MPRPRDIPLPPGARVLSIALPEGLAPAAAAKRPTRGVPNATEARFAREYLEPLRLAGEIVRYEFEGAKIRLGYRCFLTPDWLAWAPPIFLYFEVKGARRDGRPYYRDDAMVKLRAAAAANPSDRFFLCWPSASGGWHVEVVPSGPGGRS